MRAFTSERIPEIVLADLFSHDADKGCWSDLVSSRALPVGLTGSSNYTIEGCLAAAAAGGYAVAGLSYYGECWAAAGLSYYSQALDASKCTYPCRGDSVETCGGSDALDVYDSTVIKPVQGATTADLATFGPWKYDACGFGSLPKAAPMTLDSRARLLAYRLPGFGERAALASDADHELERHHRGVPRRLLESRRAGLRTRVL